MILESRSFCVSDDKAKGEIDFEDCRLISKNPIQLFSEAGWTDGG